MSRVPVDLSVVELEKILNERRATLRELMKRRELIQKELKKVDEEISSLQGSQTARKTRNKVSLRALVLNFLKKNKKGYSLAELTKLVLESGYRTTSTNFRNVLYQCLYNTVGIYHDDASGKYRYKEPEPKKKNSGLNPGAVT